MLSETFPFWIKNIGKIVNWIFNDCVINLNPRITLGSFLVTCSFIGIVLYFLLNSDFFPNINFGSNSSRSNSSGSNYDDNYKPRHEYKK